MHAIRRHVMCQITDASWSGFVSVSMFKGTGQFSTLDIKLRSLTGSASYRDDLSRGHTFRNMH